MKFCQVKDIIKDCIIFEFVLTFVSRTWRNKHCGLAETAASVFCWKMLLFCLICQYVSSVTCMTSLPIA